MCPGTIRDCILHNIWLKELVSDLASIIINHLTSTNPPGSKEILDDIDYCLSSVLKSLRVCGTFFMSMYVLGHPKISKGMVPFHIDRNNIINTIIYIGPHNIEGGYSIQMDGPNKQNLIPEFLNKFTHGNVMVGNLNKLFHGVTPWNGWRQAIHLSIKKGIIQHFCEHTDYFYKQFSSKGFPSGKFVAE